MRRGTNFLHVQGLTVKIRNAVAVVGMHAISLRGWGGRGRPSPRICLDIERTGCRRPLHLCALPQGLTAKIHEAVAAAGMRAIISRGWGGLGELPDGAAAPEDVLSVGSVPHDWLFPQCLGPPMTRASQHCGVPAKHLIGPELLP